MKTKIAIFYGGRLSEKVEEFVKAGEKLGVVVDAINYNEIYVDSEKKNNGKVLIKFKSGKRLEDYGVIYFKFVKHYREEASLIMDCISDEVKVVDSVLKRGRPSDFCKIHQMKAMIDAGLNVPRFVMGRLKYLRYKAIKKFEYPLILKGSQGDRRSQVFKFFSDDSWDKGWDTFTWREKNEGQRYMLQEYIVNTEDYRVMVLGDKVLGVMKRATGENPLLKNVFTKTELPDEVLKKAVVAAKACGVEVAGVDVVFKEGVKEPYFWEVNRAPNYDRFVEVTGVNVAQEIVKYLASLLPKN
jgi:glutathione synthase/RimK-type ligase-like ATP-grasp enzyme